MDSFNLFQSRTFKFLLSFSLFCVLFSLLFQSLKPFLMQYYYSFYTIDKSYMFLLSNTLLAFIALCSTIFNTSSPNTHESTEHVLDNDKSNQFEPYTTEAEIAEPIDSDNILETETPKEDEEENSLMIVEAKGEENAPMITDEDETEELNKKCEDFIRKMKATFCCDSYAEKSNYYNNHQNQSSLVLVN
ncbi:hypothetical protein RYX36_005355 [Vicia faba]